MAIIAEKPLLVKRAKTGKIQTYRILVKYSKEGHPVIVKQTGQIDGKKIEHTEDIKSGKNVGRANETSPKEQAVFQMESDWKKKKDEGYKDLAEVGYPDPNFMVTAVHNPEQVFALKDFLERNLPQFNTDAAGNQKPMLALSYGPKTKIEFPIYGQPKFDGVRSHIIVNSKDKTISIISRKGKKYRVPHIQEEFKKLFPFLDGKTVIFDGEIYCRDMEFEEIASAVKAIQKDTQKLQFYCYDLAEAGVPFKHRLVLLSKLLVGTNPEVIKIVPTYWLHDKDQINRFHEKCVSVGYEGAMLRTKDGPYEFGIRSKFLLKVKVFDETEFKLVKMDISGHRGIQDLKAVCLTEEGKKFSASMNGTIATKTKIWDSWQAGEILPGALLTVEHFGWTDGGKGVPRFPKGKIIRDYE